ncbi:MAG: hypothetical protein ACTSSJ_02305 [Candidatus Odinarchaeia archaeon]
MEWNKFWRELLNKWVKSKVKAWGGSNGLLIPKALNFQKGPVIINVNQNTLNAIHVGIPLYDFIKFVKKELESSLKLESAENIPKATLENYMSKVILAVRAMEQRVSSEYTDLFADPEPIRGLLKGISESIDARIRLLSRSYSKFDQLYHWRRLLDEIKSSVNALENVFEEIRV